MTYRNQRMPQAWGAAALALALAGRAPAEELTTAAVLRNVEEALGLAGWKADAAFEAAGSGSYMGNSVPGRLRIDAAGRFVQRFEGPVPYATGWNGETAWQTEFAGQTRLLELGERSDQVIFAAAVTASWLRPGAPFELTLDSSGTNGDSVLLAVRHTGGFETGTIAIERATWRPVAWKYVGSHAEQTIRLSGYSACDGVQLPTSIVQSGGSGHAAIEVEGWAAPKDATDAAAFDPPRGRTDDVAYDASIPAELHVERAPTGHLLVQPRINGRDAGWFIFDTGAGASVISSAEGDALELTALATVQARGTGGVVNSPIYRAASLQLGPVTLDAPVLVGIDLAFLTAPLGRPIAGVIGYDLISRCVAEVGLAAGTVRLHPASWTPEGEPTWARLFLPDRIPAVEGTFEGHQGLIRFDTGANGGLQMHGPAVEKFKLLEGRATEAGQAGGVGGFASVQKGRLAWLELAGQRIDDVPTTFTTQRAGTFGNPYSAGVVGGAVLRNFEMVFDYANRRVALRRVGG